MIVAKVWVRGLSGKKLCAVRDGLNAENGRKVGRGHTDAAQSRVAVRVLGSNRRGDRLPLLELRVSGTQILTELAIRVRAVRRPRFPLVRKSGRISQKYHDASRLSVHNEVKTPHLPRTPCVSGDGRGLAHRLKATLLPGVQMRQHAPTVKKLNYCSHADSDRRQ